MGKELSYTDFLVVGSGIAGLAFALEASQYGEVTIITKGKMDVSSTYLAQGGIASVTDPEDSFSLHTADTVRVGLGLCKEDIVKKVVTYAPRAIESLENWGVKFDRDQDGKYLLGREGEHSANRILHIQDYTGKAIEEALINEVRKNPRITVLENYAAVDLITQHHLAGNSVNRQPIHCWGAYILNCNTLSVDILLAQVTVLATGGAGGVYLHTTNPEGITGDGIAMAYRAGCRVSNMEFFQFHPTVLYSPDNQQPFLITEAMRGEGAIIRSRDGVAFMKQYHPKGELAARDIVARAIDDRLKQSGENCVYLDVSHLDEVYIKKRFPTIFQTCKQRGINLPKDWIPIVPAAHYTCGGISVDGSGRTDIENLFAIGETACSGMHGANRLASNSLLEGVAFAHFAALESRKLIEKKPWFPGVPEWDDSGVFDRKEWVILSHELKFLKHLMWNYMGIVRSDSRLKLADERIDSTYNTMYDFYRKNPVTRPLLEFRNLTIIAQLAVRSAMMRKESRGLHFNSDHPKALKEYQRDTIIMPQAKPQPEIHIENNG